MDNALSPDRQGLRRRGSAAVHVSEYGFRRAAVKLAALEPPPRTESIVSTDSARSLVGSDGRKRSFGHLVPRRDDGATARSADPMANLPALRQRRPNQDQGFEG